MKHSEWKSTDEEPKDGRVLELLRPDGSISTKRVAHFCPERKSTFIYFMPRQTVGITWSLILSDRKWRYCDGNV